MERILIIDDEPHIVELIRYNLESSGYAPLEAYSGPEGLEAARREQPDLILLDLMLPGMDGLEIMRQLRGDEKLKSVPIIMLTARSEEIDKVLGLEMGADDYITKPFSVRELNARIKALLRRATVQEEEERDTFTFGDVTVDHLKYEVTKKRERVDLTLKEFELLEFLIKHRGNVLTRELLLEKIWGYEYVGETRTVDVHIRHLRQKLEEDDKNPYFIETVRGIGYRFRNEVQK